MHEYKLTDSIKQSMHIMSKILSDEDMHKQIDATAQTLYESLINNQPVLVFGNGGSASDALHISAELVGKFLQKRKAYNVICLNSNQATITAWSNDVEFNDVFRRQVEAYGKKGGSCIGISTSGKSKNVVYALEFAKKIGMKTILLTGKGYNNSYDYCISVPSTDTPKIQEAHQLIYHYICRQVEALMELNLTKY